MSKTKNGFPKRTWAALQQLLRSDGRTSPRRGRRLAPLQELEDRRLLSVTPVGAEFRVNTTTQNAQQTFPQTPQAVAVNPTTGDYVVVWSSKHQFSTDTWDVFVQRYNAAGVAQGSETLVTAHVDGNNHQYASVAMSASGSFVVTWSGDQAGHWNVYAQQFSSAGVAQGSAILVDTPAGNDQEYSSIAINNAGNFVVTWSGQQSGKWQVYANEFDQNGVSQGGPIQISNSSSDEMFSQVAMNGAGNYVITWSGHQSGNWDVYAQLYGANKQPVGSIFQVNTIATNDQEYSTAAVDTSGNFTITWSGHQSGHWNIYGQSYLTGGTANGSEFQVNSTTNDDQQYSSIAFAGGANPIIAWSSNNQDGNGWGVYVQQVTPTGALVGGEVRANTYTQSDQEYATVAGAANGNVAIVWTSNNQDGNSLGVYGQRFTASVSAAAINVSTSTLLVSEDNNVVRINESTGAIVATDSTGLANNGATTGPDGSLYVADYYGKKINHYSASGSFLSSFGTIGTPAGVAFGPDGNLYVTTTNSSVEKYSPTGTSLGTFIAAGSGGLSNAKGIVWGPDGNAYVSSYGNSEIIRYNGATGAFMNVFATGSGGFEDLTFGPDNQLYVVSYGDGAVYRFNGATGAALGTFVSGLTTPYGLRFDQAGNLDVSERSLGQISTFQGATGSSLGTLVTGLTNPAYLTTTSALVTSEAGTSASFEVSLTSQPTATVTINLATSSPAEGSLSQAALTFTPGNWNVMQTITVTGLDDHIVHGDQTYQINGTAASADANFSGLTMPAVTIVNTEADVAGFTVTPTALTTSETGTSASFTIALTSQPLAPVTINLTNGNSAQGSLSQSSLTFDAVNWNTAQTVTVTGLDDHIVHGNQTYQITGAASSNDAVYNGLALTPVTVTNTEADVAGFTVAPTSIQTSMSGASASFNVLMTSAPSAPVTINLSSTKPSEGTLSTTTLTFDAGNWNVAQSVTVTGQNDLLAGGNVTYQIKGSASSSDANYNGLAMTPVSVTNVTTTQPGFVITPTTLTTSESGTTATFSIALANLPVTAVTVDLTNGNPAQGTLSQSSLTFTLLNWNVPQSVTVTGLDDHVVNGDQTYQITGIASGVLSGYNGLTIPPITVTNTENDVAGISVAPTTLTTSETGTTASFGVALTSQPTATVTINFGTSVAGQGSLSSSSLTFDATNWNVLQTVTVTGLDDHIVHGDQTYQITGAASSADANYNMTMTPVTVTNTEADVAGFTVAPTSLTTSESGTSASFTVALTSQPIAPVTISLQPTDASQGSLSQSTLIFDANNWNVAQTVAVMGLDSYMTTPSVTYQITGNASSADAVYNGLSTTPVTVTNTVTPNASSTSVIVSANPSTYGQAVTFTATVSGMAPMTGSPTGTVTFFDGASSLANVTLTGGSAAFTTSTFSAGAHNIKVTYVGDAYFSANTSNVLAETIAPATLTVTAVDATKVYGQANPTFTDTIVGLVNGDNASVVSGSAALSTPATTASGVGANAIVAAQGSLSAANYTFAFTNGTLTINPAILTITANAASKSYGQTLRFTGSEFNTGGLVNSDTVTSVTLASAGAAATATVAGSPYAISASAATGLGLSNYNVTYVYGTLTVTPASLTVTANNATKVYGQANPGFTNSFTGFVPGENASVVSGSASLTTTATASSGVGMYTIAVAQGTLNAANYTLSFANGTLTITPLVPTAPLPPGPLPSSLSLPASSASIPPISLVPVATPTSSPGGVSPGTSAPTSQSPSTVVASPALGHATGAPSGRANDGAADLSLILATGINSAMRTIQVFSPIPQAAWRDGHMASGVVNSESSLDVLGARVANALPSSALTRAAQSDDGFDVLNDEGERVPWTESGVETSMVLGTGVIAASGYVLLNSRLGLWLLGLLTSQPLWKQFDPLEVLYAWEEEDDQVKDDSEEETLLSLVD